MLSRTSIDHETKLKPLNEKDIETNGTEKIIDPDNSVGNDELKDRLLNDKGEITYPDGSVAEGEFNKLGWLDGKGKITSTNGSVIEGEFKNGKLHGEGKAMYFEEKSTISNGKMEFVEEGEFKNGWLHQGKRTFASGIVDEGEFKYSNLHGQGKSTFFMDQLRKVNFMLTDCMAKERSLILMVQLELSRKVNSRMVSYMVKERKVIQMEKWRKAYSTRGY